MLVRDSLVLPPGPCRGSRLSSYGRRQYCQRLALPFFVYSLIFSAAYKYAIEFLGRFAGLGFAALGGAPAEERGPGPRRRPRALTENWADRALLLHFPPHEFCRASRGS